MNGPTTLVTTVLPRKRSVSAFSSSAASAHSYSAFASSGTRPSSASSVFMLRPAATNGMPRSASFQQMSFPVYPLAP
jgi:hypothetical protein